MFWCRSFDVEGFGVVVV